MVIAGDLAAAAAHPRNVFATRFRISAGESFLDAAKRPALAKTFLHQFYGAWRFGRDPAAVERPRRVIVKCFRDK